MISDIRLQNFRSYEDDTFEMSGSVNIIVGPNASGKTNLLEALLVLATGGSYRVHDSEMIMFDKPWARIDARVVNSSRVVKLVSDAQVKKVYEIDGTILRRLNPHHTLPVVLFEPDNLLLLSGSPEQRRNYLDDLLEQTTTGYGQLRRQYKRTLAQRNALLKLGSKKAASQLFPWDVRLSELAGKIVRARIGLVDLIEESLPGLYQELSHAKTKLSIFYEAAFSEQQYETKLLQKLESNLENDCMRGFTTYGPHREDFSLSYDGHPASEAASRGEVRTAVLTLKILELRVLEQARQQSPILLLDDVFSELDGSRRKLLTSYIERYQSFITTTDADIVVKNFTETCNIIPLSIG